jgi:hypothetical protein
MRRAYLLLPIFALACTDAEGGDTATATGIVTDTGLTSTGDSGGTGDASGDGDSTGTSGDGDTATSGDGDTATTGDGDGTATGDGDGTTSATGDGDGTATGDGDGTATGDGDGTATGDGDGTATGDGDGTATGDGDGTATGDGDGTATGDGDGTMCGAPGLHITCDSVADNPTPLQAIGLNCPGTMDDSTPTTADSWTSPAGDAWTISAQYGTTGDWVNTEGDQMLIISTTNGMPASGTPVVSFVDGKLVNGPGDNANPDNVTTLPSPISPVNGSGGTPYMGCDFVNDCSDTLQSQWALGQNAANDLLWFDMSVTVPPDTHGYEMDFNYFTAEYPTYVNDIYNDIFVVWSTSTAYVGNVCTVNDQPCTVTALAGAIAAGVPEGDPRLAGTGMEPNGLFLQEGAGTGWYKIVGPATPGETLELTYALFDMGDTEFDTVVLLDNWAWNCLGCIPGVDEGCGVQPQ